ncbi:hypothetical protein [Rhodococcus sp. O3]|uniref:hypothetical protein n=1 Tax=Rhodococcus sp. O3 TaxID=3404919 RepID=UPI003B68565E
MQQPDPGGIGEAGEPADVGHRILRRQRIHLIGAGGADAGLIRGIFTLIQATAITDRWGATEYGRLNGLMSAPIVVVMALAPWSGAALSSLTGSYAHAYLILAAAAVLAALVATASMPRPR